MLKRGREMNSRAQITIFIIIGIVIVVTVGLFFVFREKVLPSEVNSDVKSVKLDLEDCLKNSADGAVVVVGNSGGYYNVPKDSLYYFPYLVPYYNIGVPSEKIVEGEMANYVDENFKNCVDDLKSNLSNSGVEISSENIKSAAAIKGNEIDFDVSGLWIISKGDESLRVDSLSSVVKPLRMSEILEFSRAIAEKERDAKTICVSCLSNFSEGKNFSLNVIESDKRGEYVFVVSDPQSLIEGSTYNFSFGMKYNFPECSGGGCFDTLS